MSKCTFYPSAEDGPVCGAGSDVSGCSKPCTKDNEARCVWAKERKGLYADLIGKGTTATGRKASMPDFELRVCSNTPNIREIDKEEVAHWKRVLHGE